MLFFNFILPYLVIKIRHIESQAYENLTYKTSTILVGVTQFSATSMVISYNFDIRISPTIAIINLVEPTFDFSLQII